MCVVRCLNRATGSGILENMVHSRATYSKAQIWSWPMSPEVFRNSWNQAPRAACPGREERRWSKWWLGLQAVAGQLWLHRPECHARTWVCMLCAQSCLLLFDPMNCSPPSPSLSMAWANYLISIMLKCFCKVEMKMY